MRRMSYPENQKEVYKFWLGLFEKAAIVSLTVIVVPLIIGQLKYSLFITAFDNWGYSGIICVNVIFEF